MPKLYYVITLFVLLLSSCSKRQHPSKPVADTPAAVISNDSLAAKKQLNRGRKYVAPKVITVNDNAAHKSIDGRLYYDLLGHRYWKNYKDGKYYLFNQAMYSNDAFKPR